MGGDFTTFMTQAREIFWRSGLKTGAAQFQISDFDLRLKGRWKNPHSGKRFA
jgi:hypothetical protein